MKGQCKARGGNPHSLSGRTHISFGFERGGGQDLLCLRAEFWRSITHTQIQVHTRLTDTTSGQVPDLWEKKAYPSLKPLGAWADDLMARLDFITKWVDENTPIVYWISGFYFPQAFLTGTRQNFARKMQYAIDTIEFSFPIVDTPWEQITEKPDNGAYIRGIYSTHPRNLLHKLALIVFGRRQNSHQTIPYEPCISFRSLHGGGAMEFGNSAS